MIFVWYHVHTVPKDSYAEFSVYQVLSILSKYNRNQVDVTLQPSLHAL